MAVAERLKCSLRHSWTSSGRQESVAEHSWRLALLAALVSDEFPGLDREKLLLLCLFHDIGEAFTGDIPPLRRPPPTRPRSNPPWRPGWLPCPPMFVPG